MALRSLIQLRGYIESLAGGSKNIVPADITNATPPEAETELVLASGDNTITIPALADGCIIIFASTSTTTKTLKGVGGDTGIAVTKNSWLVLTFHTTPPANFIINSSAVDTGLYTRIIFF